MTQRKQNSTNPNGPQHTNEIVSGEKKSDERSKLAFPEQKHMRMYISWIRLNRFGIIPF
jgi:hypothetical protein